jgi:hypothetical protein
MARGRASDESWLGMSIFGHRKPRAVEHPRDQLATLRNTLKKLEAESEETPRIAELKRILAARIVELEVKDPPI